MTLAEFAALPDEPGKQELIKGELVCVPPPKRRHGRMQNRLVGLLTAYAAQHGAEVYTNTGFRLSADTCVEPDVALVLPSQLAQPDMDDWFQGAPALAVEILSPSNRASVMDDKVQSYLAAGAAAVCVVNPPRQRVTVYSGGRFEILEVPHGILACEQLPGLSLPLSAIFA